VDMAQTITGAGVTTLPLAPKNPLPYWQRLSAARSFDTGLEKLRDAGGAVTRNVLGPNWMMPPLVFIASPQGARDVTRYFIVALSPHAVASTWVNKEVAHWLKRRGPDQLLFVVADGRLTWDESTGRFDPDRSDVALPVLTEPGVLATEYPPTGRSVTR
jgi:hypothetical protein